MFSDKNNVFKMSNSALQGNKSSVSSIKKIVSNIPGRKNSYQSAFDNKKHLAVESYRNPKALNKESEMQTSRSSFQIRRGSKPSIGKAPKSKEKGIPKEEMDAMQSLIKELEMKKLQKEQEIQVLEKDIDDESKRWFKEMDDAVSQENLLSQLQDENARLENQLKKELKMFGLESEEDLTARNKWLSKELKIWKEKNSNLDDLFHLIRLEEENITESIQSDYQNVDFSQIEDLFQRLADFIDENDEFNEEMYLELKNGLEEKKKEYNDLKNELESFNSIHGFEKEELQKELFSLNYDFESKKELLVKKKEAMKIQLAKEEKEKNGLLGELKEILGRSLLTDSDIQEELAIKEKEVNALKSQISSLQKINNETNLKALLEKTKAEYDYAKKEYTGMKEEAKALKETNEKLKGEAEKKEKEWEETQKAIDDEISGYQRLLEQLKKEKEDAEKELQETEQSLAQREALKSESQREIEAKEEAELFTKRQEIEELKTSIEEKNVEIEKIKAENKKVEEELTQTNELLMAYNREIENNMETLNELTEKESSYLLNLSHNSGKK